MRQDAAPHSDTQEESPCEVYDLAACSVSPVNPVPVWQETDANGRSWAGQ